MMFAKRSFCEPVSIVASHHPNSRTARRSRLVGLCAVLVVLLCASWSNVFAQATQYVGFNPWVGFNQPYGVAVDGSGNIYVADTDNNAVKEMLAVNGAIPVVPTVRTLGSGFNYPVGVAVDGRGNVYVADLLNSAVKEILAVNGSVPASPTIRTLGSGISYPNGVAVDSSGNVYVADEASKAVFEMLAVNGSIPASPTIRTLGSAFQSPYGVAVDANGNVFVSDDGPTGSYHEYGAAVYEIEAVNGSIPASPTIRSLIPNILGGVGGVTVDSSGNVYLVNWGILKLYEVLAVNGAIPASPSVNTVNCWCSDPSGIAVDSSGNIYLSDLQANG